MNTQIKHETKTHAHHKTDKHGYLRPLLLVGTALVLLVLFGIGFFPRQKQSSALAAQSAEAKLPHVIVTKAQRGSAVAELVLPSTTEALQDTPIYARTNGYLRKFHADIGAKVEAGQLLAEIETPETDELLNQARAVLEQSRSNLNLATISYQRLQDLLNDRAVSQQEVDDRKAAFDARTADLAAAEANVQRLTRLQSFQKVTAPYAGTIVARNIDNGSLVTGENNEADRMLFRLAQTDVLRVYVNVPQNYYRLVAEGQTANLTFAEFPGRVFTGKVVRTAGALDAASRTLRTEIQVPNEKGELIPGLYSEVSFKLPQANPPLVIPSRALIIQSDGPQVAVVNDDQTVRLVPVVLGRDFGKTLEVASGLEEGASLVINPTDRLHAGTKVQIEEAPQPQVAQK